MPLADLNRHLAIADSNMFHWHTYENIMQCKSDAFLTWLMISERICATMDEHAIRIAANNTNVTHTCVFKYKATDICITRRVNIP